MPRSPLANREIREARRKEILSAGFAVLAEGGIKKLTFTNVADRIGCPHSLLYHYFANKEELLQALAKESANLHQVEWARAQRVGSIEGLTIVSSFFEENRLAEEDERNFILFELRRGIREEDDARIFGKDPLSIMAGLLEQAAREELIPFSDYREKAKVIFDYLTGYLVRLSFDEKAAYSKTAFNRLVRY